MKRTLASWGLGLALVGAAGCRTWVAAPEEATGLVPHAAARWRSSTGPALLPGGIGISPSRSGEGSSTAESGERSRDTSGAGSPRDATATPAGPSPEASFDRRQRESEPPPAVAGNYTLRVGDRLELVYTESLTADREYRLFAGDEIRIEYLHLGTAEVGGGQGGLGGPSNLDRTVRIQPDGRISLPYIGMVDAAGQTIPGLINQLNDRYRQFYVDPRMHVTLVSSGSTLRELRKSLRAAGSHLVEVGPDGRLNLPYLGIAPAAGLTLAELQTELVERYQRAVPGLAVTVRLVRLANGAGQGPRPAVGNGSMRATPTSPRGS